jgi:hypothetical protein
MIKLYIEATLPTIPFFMLFESLGGAIKPAKRLFQNVTIKNPQELYIQVSSLQEADYIAIPYNYFSIKSNTAYIKRIINMSAATSKKILLFAYGDSDEDISIPQSIVFRTSQYKYKKKDNEILMPAYVEDLMSHSQSKPRIKSQSPTVGFTGFAGFKSSATYIKYLMKILVCEIKTIIRGKQYQAHKPGIYFRRKAISIINTSKVVISNIIIRSTYSGNARTIELSPTQARQEYIENIVNSDFILAPKGDGNYSLRFFEILSLGRIPVLIDTECLLPLTEMVPYNKCIVKIDYRDIHKCDEIIAMFYNLLSPEEFINMQLTARKVFEEYLSFESFFKIAFEKITNGQTI